MRQAPVWVWLLLAGCSSPFGVEAGDASPPLGDGLSSDAGIVDVASIEASDIDAAPAASFLLCFPLAGATRFDPQVAFGCGPGWQAPFTNGATLPAGIDGGGPSEYVITTYGTWPSTKEWVVMTCDTADNVVHVVSSLQSSTNLCPPFSPSLLTDHVVPPDNQGCSISFPNPVEQDAGSLFALQQEWSSSGDCFVGP
jgi:hypothetical protein